MDLEHLVIDNIRRIRKEKGITQEKLAEYCGTSASYIGLMETYKNIPKLSTIQKIAEALNVPVQEIFSVTSEPSEKQENVELKNRIKKQIMRNFESQIDEVLKMM